MTSPRTSKTGAALPWNKWSGPGLLGMCAHFYRRFGKRLLDVALVLSSLPLLVPLLLITAVLVRILLGKPILFCQRRPGLRGRPFILYKFRTMATRQWAAGRRLRDDERLTRTGRWLRLTSLDELPQLANVLLGQMSLVGPRPLLMEYLDRYTRSQARRHDVRPGLTGWAQVNGRNGISWDDKFALDLWYVDHCCLLLDCRILLRTMTTVLRRDGICAGGCITPAVFLGSGSNTRTSGEADRRRALACEKRRQTTTVQPIPADG